MKTIAELWSGIFTKTKELDELLKDNTSVLDAKFARDLTLDRIDQLENHDCHASPEDGCRGCEELEKLQEYASNKFYL